jgi:dTDP-4-amino-4,6-dideoxygalactose transaminase
MDKIREIANRQNLLVIEDAAHAVGSEWQNQLIGAFSPATVFSFYATKNLTTAEGGMITTEEDDFAEEMRIWVLHGMTRDAWKRYTSEGNWYYEVVLPGFKYNMMDIQAAMGLHQLTRMESIMQRREQLAEKYFTALDGLDELELPTQRDNVRHAWHLFPIRLRPEFLKINRADFIEALKSEGIATSVHFIPLHRHPYYRDRFSLRPDDFPVADDAYQNLISLPLYTRMTEQDTRDVVRAVIKVITQNHA